MMTGAPVVIRIDSATEADVGEMLAIARESFPTPWTEEIFRLELANPAAFLFAARTEPKPGQESVIAGYVAGWSGGGEIHVTAITTHPFYRRRRVGLRLMLYLLSQARAEGIRQVTLEVRRSNLAARRLYQQLGMAPSGVRTGYYHDTGEDAILMTLYDLSAPECYFRLRHLRKLCTPT